MSPELIIAVSSAVLSLASGAFSVRASNKAARQLRRETAAEEHERILHLYREPLVDVANALQARLFNIMARDFLVKFYLQEDNEDDRAYARDNTIYTIAEYLCWVEILRRELRFRDLGNEQRNQELMRRLLDIQYAFQRDDASHQFEIFRGRQRAIAEVMMVPTNAPEGPRSECLGYAAFTDRLANDPGFARWFTRLRSDVEVVARATRDENVRLAWIQRELIDLIDFLDPRQIKVPANVRNRLPEPTATPTFTPAAI